MKSVIALCICMNIAEFCTISSYSWSHLYNASVWIAALSNLIAGTWTSSIGEWGLDWERWDSTGTSGDWGSVMRLSKNYSTSCNLYTLRPLRRYNFYKANHLNNPSNDVYVLFYCCQVIEQGLTSAPTQYRLYGRRVLLSRHSLQQRLKNCKLLIPHIYHARWIVDVGVTRSERQLSRVHVILDSYRHIDGVWRLRESEGLSLDSLNKGWTLVKSSQTESHQYMKCAYFLYHEATGSEILQFSANVKSQAAIVGEDVRW